MSHHSLPSRCEEISGNIEAMEDQSISFLKHLTTELREMEHTSGSRLHGNLHNIKVTLNIELLLYAEYTPDDSYEHAEHTYSQHKFKC